MALVSPLTLVTGSATPRFVSDSADELLVSAIQTGQAAGNLFTDATPTTINLGTNAALTNLNLGTGMGAGDAISVGGAGSTATFNGNVTVSQNLTVNGTTTTVNSTQLTVVDPLITANIGGVAGSSAGIGWDQGANDDAVLLWNGTQFQFGTFDTVGGTVNPTNLTTFSDLQLNNLIVEGGDITAGTAASLDLLGGTNVSITAGSNAGNSVNISAPNATGTVTIATNGATRWTVDENGNLLAAADNTQNIGAAGANRPQTIFVGTSTVVGNTVTTTGSSITGSNTIATLLIQTAAGDASNAAANLAITGGSSGNVANPDGANVTITAGTADATGVDGSVTLVAPNVGATPGDVSFTAHGTTIPVNEAGANASLNTTEQNLVGAINEVLATIPGSQDLAQTLAAGNTTGANDIVVSDGQAIVGASDGGFNIGNVGALRPDNVRVLTSVVVGNSVSITTNAVTGSTTLAVSTLAGALSLQPTGGGISAGPAINGAGAGFGVTIDGGASSVGAAAGGDVTINGGAPGAGGTAGVVNVGTTNTSQINLGDGSNVVDIPAGTTFDVTGVTVTGLALATVLGNGNQTGANDVIVTSGQSILGQAGSAAVGGDLPLQAGAGDTNFAGGVASLTGGAGAGTGAGGAANLVGGAASGTGAGGAVSVLGGTPTAGAGGTITITAGPGVGTNQAGGAVTITGGASTGTADGANVTVSGGTAGGTGVDGRVVFVSGGTTYGLTAASVAGPALTTTAQTIIEAINEINGNANAGTTQRTVTNSNAGAITVGQVLYFDGAGAGTVDLATAATNSAASRGYYFVSDASIASAATGTANTGGTTQVRLETGLTISEGDILFLSASTPGSATNVAPSGTGNIVQVIGQISDVQTYDGATDLLVEAEIVIGNRAQV